MTVPASTATPTPHPRSTPDNRAPSLRVLVTWLLSLTRPVLPPLAASALCRIVAHLAGCAMLALGAGGLIYAATADAAARTASLWWPLALMAALALLKAAVRYGEQYLGHLVAFHSLEILRAALFDAVAPRAPRLMLTTRSGDLLTRATKDVDRIETFYAHTLAPAVSAIVVPLTVLLTIGATTSWTLAAVGALTTIAALLVPAVGWRLTHAAARRGLALRAELTQHLTDTVQGRRDIVGFGRQDDWLERTAVSDAAIARAARPLWITTAVRHVCVRALILSGPLALLIVGARLTDPVSPVLLAASAAAVLRLGETIRGVEDLWATLGDAIAAAERVHAVVTAPVELADGTTTLPAQALAVRWDNLTYAYPGMRDPALYEVTACARAGEWTSLVGASGSGKTTMAHLALRFDDPTQGSVCIGETDLRDIAADCLRGRVALVGQNAALLRGSVADNLRLAAPDASEEQMRHVARLVGIDRDIDAMPHGYDTLIAERGTSVSGGQRQRIVLARALLTCPHVLVLDEFTSHLDARSDAQVRTAVRTWARDHEATVIEVTHRLHDIERADHVVVLDRGRVVESGTPAHLLTQPDSALRRLRQREDA